VGRRAQEEEGKKMNSAESFEKLAKAFYNAGGTAKNFAEATRKATKVANRPDWPKTYFESKRKKKVAKHG
jgi:hypothetical protein